MPLFKGKASKAKPQKAIDYITDPKKAVIISSQSMDDSNDLANRSHAYRNYAKQFKETCDIYGKGSKSDERKYYHFKLSCNPIDNPAPQQSHELAEKLAQQLFADYECVIATHNDTDTLHTHIIVNAVSFETGLKLHMNNTAYRHSKDLVNTLAAEMGLSTMDWRTKTKEKRERSKSGEAITADSKYLSSAERNMAKQGNLDKGSWKEALRYAIDEAKAHCTDRAEFQRYLHDTFGVTMTRNTGKTVTFVHPAVGENYAVRGVKLGVDYTAVAIDEALTLNKQVLNQNNTKIPQNQEGSVLDERFFTQTQHTVTGAAPSITTKPSITKAAPNTAVHTGASPTATTGIYHANISPRPYDWVSPSQRQRQAEHRKRTTPRSISDISAELRSIDRSVGEIAGRVYEEYSEPSERNNEPVPPIGTNAATTNDTHGRTDRETFIEPAKSVGGLYPEPPRPTPQPRELERAIRQKSKRHSYQNSR